MTSIDGIGAVNDYIRWGSNFKEVEKNFIKITKLFDYTIATCVSALNVHRYHEIKDFAKYHNAHIEHVMVKDIPAIDPWNCPEELKSTVSDEHREIVSRQGNKGLLKKYIRLWDEQRGIKITDYMPEFEVIIK
jgi:sulfatase maturation enzyme AslB (radical SAM superfamily)